MLALRKTLKLLLLLGTIATAGLLGVLMLTVGKESAETMTINRSVWSRYGVAVGLSGLVSLGLWVLAPVYGYQSPPLVLNGLAIAAAAWWGGLGPGLLTIVLSSVFSWWALVPPLYTFQLPDFKESLRLLFTVFTGAVISALAEASHRAAARQHAATTELQALLDNMLDGFAKCQLLFDDNGQAVDFIPIYVNRAYSELTGLKNVVGKRITETIPGIREADPEVFQIYGRVARTGHPERVEIYLKSMGFWLTLSVYRVSHSQFAVAFHNITARKQAELALQTSEARLACANTELEQKVHQRTAELRATIDDLEHFSYSIVHDMRAPLRTMRSFADILLMNPKSSLTEEEYDFLRRIATSATMMDNLIVAALAYSQAMRTELPLGPVEPAAVLQEILAIYPDFQPLTTNIRIEGSLPPVLANGAGLTQVFSNLLRNAIKFVAPGVRPAVQISAEVHDDWVRLWVADNGIGIAPEFRGRLFKMFERASRDYEGTGIGLALVSKMIQRMNGRVGVESVPGQGSRFWIELKVATTENTTGQHLPTGN